MKATKSTTKTALVSSTGIGSTGTLFECRDANDLMRRVTDAGSFVRVSYTNAGAHQRTHTWFPIISLNAIDCDFKIESRYE